jgi:hypothetical protein
MNRGIVCVSIAVVSSLAIVPIAAHAQPQCPPEVDAAKSALQTRQQEAAASTLPRQLVGARSQDVEAPRSQDVQAPRSQDVQAPRSQDVQAPRSQDVQAPRSQPDLSPRSDAQAPRAPSEAAPSGPGADASPLAAVEQMVKDAEAACAAKDMTRASALANSALEKLRSMK